jgi:hypothetical protein
VQGAARTAGIALAIRRLREQARVVLVHVDERVQLAVECCDAGEAVVDDLARRGLALGEQRCELAERAH